MVKILGLPLGTFLIRLGGAIVTGIITLVLFLYLPQLLYSNLPELGKATGITVNYIVYYAVLITILSGISTIYRDHLLGDVASVANGLSQIYYIYIITNGGVLSLALNGITIAINFSTLLYFLITPSAILVVSSVIRMISRSAMKPYNDAEQVLLV
jgi:hypothetical protein